MSKQEFFTKLERLLRRVPEHERKEMLYDYIEHFEVGLDNGKSEEELINELGEPEQIARDLLTVYRVELAEKDKSVSNMMNAIFATTSLSFINIVFVLGPVLGLLGVYIALCGVAIALTLSPVLLILSLLFNGAVGSLVVNFFVTITLCSLGLLMGIGMIKVGKYLYNIILRYIKFNIHIIKGGQAV
ncbi:HAAS signaling domain-containing protein [Cytobacillus sp. Hm23]